MSSKAKKPDPRKVKLTQGQADIITGLTAEARAIEGRTQTVVATIAAGAGIEKFGKVGIDGLVMTFGEPEEA